MDREVGFADLLAGCERGRGCDGAQVTEREQHAFDEAALQQRMAAQRRDDALEECRRDLDVGRDVQRQFAEAALVDLQGDDAAGERLRGNADLGEEEAATLQGRFEVLGRILEIAQRAAAADAGVDQGKQFGRLGIRHAQEAEALDLERRPAVGRCRRCALRAEFRQLDGRARRERRVGLHLLQDRSGVGQGARGEYRLR